MRAAHHAPPAVRCFERVFPACAVPPVILNLGSRGSPAGAFRRFRLGAHTGSHKGAAASLSSIGSKSIWTTRTPQGTLTDAPALTGRRAPVRRSEQLFLAGQRLVDGGLHGLDSTPRGVASSTRRPSTHRRACAAPACALRVAQQIVGDVERRHHRDAVGAGDLAAARGSRACAGRGTPTASCKLGALVLLARDLVVAAEQRDVERHRAARRAAASRSFGGLRQARDQRVEALGGLLRRARRARGCVLVRRPPGRGAATRSRRAARACARSAWRACARARQVAVDDGSVRGGRGQRHRNTIGGARARGVNRRRLRRHASVASGT